MTNQLPPTDSTSQAVLVFRMVVLSLSTLSCFFCMLLIVFSKNLRQFALYLVFNLLLSNLVSAIGSLIVTDTTTIQNQSAGCQIQAAVIHFSDISSCFWMGAIAYSLYINVTKNEDSVLYLHSKILVMNLVCYVIPFTISIILVALEKYGINGEYYCWLKVDQTEESKKQASFIGMLTFYMPMWSCIGYIFGVQILVKIKMGQVSNLNAHPQARLLKYFPFTIIVAYTPTSLYRVVQLCGGSPPVFLSTLHIMMNSCMGIFNCFLFLTRPVVRTQLKVIKHFVEIKCCRMITFSKKYQRSPSKKLDSKDIEVHFKRKSSSGRQDWVKINKQKSQLEEEELQKHPKNEIDSADNKQI